MNVFLVSNYSTHSTFHQTLKQITVAIFIRSGYEVTTSSLEPDNEQELLMVRNSKHVVAVQDNPRLHSDRYKLVSADKLIFQLQIHGSDVFQSLENWFQQVFSKYFIHQHRHILSEKTALFILSYDFAVTPVVTEVKSLQEFLDPLINKYFKPADIQVLPTHIALHDMPGNRHAEKNYIYQYSKKIQFYALLLSSSILKAN